MTYSHLSKPGRQRQSKGCQQISTTEEMLKRYLLIFHCFSFWYFISISDIFCFTCGPLLCGFLSSINTSITLRWNLINIHGIEYFVLENILWNLVVIVGDFVLLDKAVSNVFESLISKWVNNQLWAASGNPRVSPCKPSHCCPPPGSRRWRRPPTSRWRWQWSGRGFGPGRDGNIHKKNFILRLIVLTIKLWSKSLCDLINVHY